MLNMLVKEDMGRMQDPVHGPVTGGRVRFVG